MHIAYYALCTAAFYWTWSGNYTEWYELLIHRFTYLPNTITIVYFAEVFGVHKREQNSPAIDIICMLIITLIALIVLYQCCRSSRMFNALYAQCTHTHTMVRFCVRISGILANVEDQKIMHARSYSFHCDIDRDFNMIFVLILPKQHLYWHTSDLKTSCVQ